MLCLYIFDEAQMHGLFLCAFRCTLFVICLHSPLLVGKRSKISISRLLSFRWSVSELENIFVPYCVCFSFVIISGKPQLFRMDVYIYIYIPPPEQFYLLDLNDHYIVHYLKVAPRLRDFAIVSGLRDSFRLTIRGRWLYPLFC